MFLPIFVELNQKWFCYGKSQNTLVASAANKPKGRLSRKSGGRGRCAKLAQSADVDLCFGGSTCCTVCSFMEAI